MNLFVEYLIRSGSIQSFLEMPSSLFLESKNSRNKVIFLIDSIEETDSVLFKIYDFNSKFQIFPKEESVIVKRDDVFKNCLVENMKPIPYVDQAVNFLENNYNEAMSDYLYQNFNKNLLNSLKHRAYKNDWLWSLLTDVFFNGLLNKNKMNLSFYSRKLIIEKEMNIVRKDYKDINLIWTLWKLQFLYCEKAAPEIVFHSLYNNL